MTKQKLNLIGYTTAIVTFLIAVIAYKKQIQGPFRSIYLMLLNIPYAFFCIWFAIYLSGYYRVTIINDTNNTVREIKMWGCDTATIKSLQKVENQTIWLDLTHDCTQKISYFDENGKRFEEYLSGYLCSGMGRQNNFNISGKGNSIH